MYNLTDFIRLVTMHAENFLKGALYAKSADRSHGGS